MVFGRRAFFSWAMGAGLAGYAGSRAVAQTAPNVGSRTLTKVELPTPALLLDLDAFEANLKAMADHCRRTNCSFRPHAKTHKCPEIAKRQVASGALGISVATVPEAEAMVHSGLRGILLTSPILEPNKITRMVQLAKSGGEVILAVGDRRQIELLAEAAEASGVRVDVLIDIDVIDGRTGALPGPPALELARQVDEARFLTLRGLQAYAGSASHTVGFERRQHVSRQAMAKAVETRDLLLKSGLDASILSAGSTGTYNIDSDIQGVTELQVGSYVFMDVDYMRIGGKDGNEVYTDFRPSLTVLTTVVSAAHTDRVTVDAGVKAFAPSPHPVAKDWQGLAYRPSGDEFGAITAEPAARLPRLGERFELIAPHCDPTVNLYDHLYAMRGEMVEAIWPITSRREFSPNRPIDHAERAG